MTNESGAGWICTCKRRVPQRVASCRCGAQRPASPLGVSDPAEEASSGFAGVLKVAAFVVMIGLSVVWYRHFDVSPAAPETSRPALQTAVPPPRQSLPPAAQPDPGIRFPITPVAPPQVRREDTWRLNLPPPSGLGTPPQVRPAEPERLTDTDRRRLEGLAKLRQVYSAIAGQAGSLLQMVATYEANCSGQADSRCQSLYQQIGRTAIVIALSLDAAEDLCRTHYLEPGLAREAREALGLDDRMWDDIVRLVRQHRR
jgi:hypothetical protein